VVPFSDTRWGPSRSRNTVLDAIDRSVAGIPSPGS
jgi:hypothetical protein